MSISENVAQIRKDIPDRVKLVVVSKNQSNDSILEAYNCGERIFGENKVQELVEKQKSLPKDIVWHMIGHLQTNKVKQIAPFVSLIHAVDSFKLLKEINKQAKNNDRIIECLIQFHIAEEKSKHGFSSVVEVLEILASDEFNILENINIIGVMGMATNTVDMSKVKSEFVKLHKISIELEKANINSKANFKEISMGMSSDYLIAIKQFSTIIRVGSKIFT